MQFLANKRVEREQLLLKQCHEDNEDALERFATRSYKSEVERAVRLSLRQSYLPAEVEDVVKLCMGHIYKHWRSIPSSLHDLHRRIRDAARKFAHDFIRADLEAE
jgi:hypothetical protein